MPDPRALAAAAVLAVPVGALAWFEAAYLYFGLTGEDAPEALALALGAVAFGMALGWPLRRAARAAQVVRSSCQLGIVFAVLLPVVALAVLLLWENSPERRDLGMGGLMLYGMPVIAAIAGALFLLLFWGLAAWASSRLEPRKAALMVDGDD